MFTREEIPKARDKVEIIIGQHACAVEKDGIFGEAAIVADV
jgi:hypothetical protein